MVIASAALRSAVAAVEDPELPVAIGDLGMVRDVAVDPATGAVEVRLVSTYSGCPAQLFIQRDVEAAVAGLAPDAAVRVHWDPVPWSPDAITPAGREGLAELGVALPGEGLAAPTCPYCGADVEVTSEAGSSLCRSLGYCRTCRNPVDVMRRPGEPAALAPGPRPVAIARRPR